MITLIEEFNLYLAACYVDPSRLPTAQIKEVRQAFFSGALLATTAILSVPDAGGTDEEIEERLKALVAEIENAARPISTGKPNT